MARKSVPEGLAAELRRAIEASGLSLNQIGQRAGMDHSRLSRFMRGERGLTTDAVERIGQAIGLRLTWAEGDKPGPAEEVPPSAEPQPRGRPRKPTPEPAPEATPAKQSPRQRKRE